MDMDMDMDMGMGMDMDMDVDMDMPTCCMGTSMHLMPTCQHESSVACFCTLHSGCGR